MTSDSKPRDDSQAFPDIDRIIHEPARLMIVAHLYVVTEGDFLFLERQTGLTRGNLSSHLGKLESAGYIDIRKEFIEKIPHTVVRLTDTGRQAFESYRLSMRTVLDSDSGSH
ncbi:MAG: transcriptional regulator [Candidatus Zixiibacteriota bacterium]|nr:MAG: transcriptional regulator [candidate division Zixibacteria bacterium]